MSKRLENREQAIERLAAYLLEAGLSETSLRQLASAAGVSDRMLLYYFEDKSEVMVEALRRVVVQLVLKLEASLPADQPMPPQRLFEEGAKLVTGPDLRPYMQISIEIAAAAGRGQEPFPSLAREIFQGFLMWVQTRLVTEDPELKRAQAALILTMIDGMSVLAPSVEPDMLERAAKQMSALLADG